MKKITKLEKEKIYEAVCSKDRNSLANVIVNLYNKRKKEVPSKINICRPLPNDDCIFDNSADLYNWFKNDRDKELAIINDTVYKLYYERYYNRCDDFVDYNLTMECVGKISR